MLNPRGAVNDRTVEGWIDLELAMVPRGAISDGDRARLRRNLLTIARSYAKRRPLRWERSSRA